MADEVIWNMRIQGYSYADIEKELDIDRSSAYLACHRYFEFAREKLHDSQEITVLLELARLDAMLKKIWPKLDESATCLNAVKSILSIMERRAAYLGLDESGLKKLPKDSAREIYEHMQEIVHATGYGWQ